MRLAPVAALDRREGQDHRDRRADQDERVGGGQVDAQGVGGVVVGQRPVVGLQRLDLGLGARRRRAGRGRVAASAGVTPRTTSTGACSTRCSASCALTPAGLVRGSRRPARGRRPARVERDALGVRQPGEVGAGGVEVAVGRRRAPRAEDDVGADQAGEEHDLGGQEQPHRDLAGRDRRVLDGRGRGRGDVLGEFVARRGGGGVCHRGFHLGSVRFECDRRSDQGRSSHSGSGFRSNSARTAGRYRNEARSSRRADESETSDQNRTDAAR